MARVQTKSSTPGDGSWYVPDLDGNREDPDPFRVLIAPISAEDMLRMERESGRLTRGKLPNVMQRSQEHIEHVIERYVLAVRGYELRIQGGSQGDSPAETIRPTDGKSLLAALKQASPSEYKAVTEDIFAAIEDASKLAEGAEKKS